MRTPWTKAAASTLTEAECAKILRGFNRVMTDGEFEAAGLAAAELLMLFRAGFTPVNVNVGGVS